jgi:hypothetical protein
MKFRLAILLLAALASPLFGAAVTIINPQPPASSTGRVETVVNAQTVASTGTVSSNALDQAYAQFYGLWYQCTSASSTPNVSISWLESPTTESTDFVAVGTSGEAPPVISSLTDEVAHILSLQVPPMRYGRALITGISGNPADTVCTLKIFAQGAGVGGG